MREKILQLIEKLYCKKYTGKIKVEKIKDGYTLVLGLNQEERPIRISGQMGEKDFLKYVENELRLRHLETTEYYYGYKIDIDD